MPKPSSFVGVVAYLGESEKAFKVCSIDAITDDIRVRLEMTRDPVWIPKSVVTHFDIQPHKKFPLQKQITMTLKSWFVEQNTHLEEWFEKTESADEEDTYDRSQL